MSRTGISKYHQNLLKFVQNPTQFDYSVETFDARIEEIFKDFIIVD